MEEIANEWLDEMGSDWHAVDDCVLESCCGDRVEYDLARCPTCSAPNPLFAAGLI